MYIEIVKAHCHFIYLLSIYRNIEIDEELQEEDVMAREVLAEVIVEKVTIKANNHRRDKDIQILANLCI